MDELGLVGDLAIVIVAALAGGLIAHLLRLPAILGYLTAGLVIGPHTSALVSEVDRVETAADLGVALLMFTIGVKVSFRALRRARDVAVVGGIVQIAVMLTLGVLLGRALGLDGGAAVLLGMVVAISSTMVALSLLERRAEVDSLQGGMSAGVLLVEDLAVVALIAIVPALGGESGGAAGEIGIALAKAAAMLVAIYLLGVRLVPWLFSRVIETRSRELFLLAIVSIALGTAAVSFLAGLSLAFGAFLAGLLVSESDYGQETIAEVLPLREVFAVVFFVSIGMLIEPRVFGREPAMVFGVAALGVFGKAALVTAVAMAFRYPAAAALAAGLALANMGEFSFVLMEIGVDEGVLTRPENEAILAAVLLSIAAGAILVEAQPLVKRAVFAGPLRPLLDRPRVRTYEPPGGAELVNHAVICGYEEAARELVTGLDRRNLRYVVVDDDPYVISQLRRQGRHCIYGDPSSAAALALARLERARVMAVVTRDVAAARAIVATGRRLAPKLDIVVRGTDVASHLALQDAGATEVVHAEFEVGLEFARHALHRFGVSSQEIQAALARRRRDYYTTG